MGTLKVVTGAAVGCGQILEIKMAKLAEFRKQEGDCPYQQHKVHCVFSLIFCRLTSQKQSSDGSSDQLVLQTQQAHVINTIIQQSRLSHNILIVSLAVHLFLGARIILSVLTRILIVLMNAWQVNPPEVARDRSIPGALQSTITQFVLELQDPKLRQRKLSSTQLINVFRADPYFKPEHQQMQGAIEYGNKGRMLYALTFFMTGISFMLVTSQLARTRWFKLTYRRNFAIDVAKFFLIPMLAGSLVEFASTYPLKELAIKQEIFSNEEPYWRRVDDYLDYLRKNNKQVWQPS